MPLLHDHLLLSVKGQRLDGKWGSIHTLALHENTVAASALYNELVAAEVCEALGLATELRTPALASKHQGEQPLICGTRRARRGVLQGRVDTVPASLSGYRAEYRTTNTPRSSLVCVRTETGPCWPRGSPPVPGRRNSSRAGNAVEHDDQEPEAGRSLLRRSECRTWSSPGPARRTGSAAAPR
jgi:hypothetical protein